MPLQVQVQGPARHGVDRGSIGSRSGVDPGWIRGRFWADPTSAANSLPTRIISWTGPLLQGSVERKLQLLGLPHLSRLPHLPRILELRHEVVVAPPVVSAAGVLLPRLCRSGGHGFVMQVALAGPRMAEKIPLLATRPEKLPRRSRGAQKVARNFPSRHNNTPKLLSELSELGRSRADAGQML